MFDKSKSDQPIRKLLNFDRFFSLGCRPKISLFDDLKKHINIIKKSQ